MLHIIIWAPANIKYKNLNAALLHVFYATKNAAVMEELMMIYLIVQSVQGFGGYCDDDHPVRKVKK